jgi:hypothetical protein
MIALFDVRQRSHGEDQIHHTASGVSLSKLELLARQGYFRLNGSICCDVPDFESPSAPYRRTGQPNFLTERRMCFWLSIWVDPQKNQRVKIV